MNKHQKDECYDIGLHAKKLDIILGSVFSTIGR